MEAKFFTNNLNFASVEANLNTKTNSVYKAALEDSSDCELEIGQYLSDIYHKAEAFIQQTDKMWDRKELIEGFKVVQKSRGNFVCLLGGKNTGKSLLIKNIFKAPSTYIIDLRANCDILENLTKVLSTLPQDVTYDMAKNVREKGFIPSNIHYVLLKTLRGIFQKIFFFSK